VGGGQVVVKLGQAGSKAKVFQCRVGEEWLQKIGLRCSRRKKIIIRMVNKKIPVRKEGGEGERV
jgi:hypothetical protein